MADGRCCYGFMQLVLVLVVYQQFPPLELLKLYRIAIVLTDLFHDALCWLCFIVFDGVVVVVVDVVVVDVVVVVVVDGCGCVCVCVCVCAGMCVFAPNVLTLYCNVLYCLSPYCVVPCCVV